MENTPTETGQWDTPKGPKILLKTLGLDRECQLMKADIKGKIKKVLRQKTYSEPDVVYLLVECYKFLGEPKNKFSVLKFYRNWACHSFLLWDTAKIFKEVHNLIKAREPSKNLIVDKVRKSFIGYSFLKLEKELEEIFKLFGYKEKFNWRSFRVKLYKIICDTPLFILKNEDVIFQFKCKEIFKQLSFDDLEIAVWVKDRLFFTVALNDKKLELDPRFWFQSPENRF